jgi:membrane protease YdiL (CAAX protease family)
MAGLFVLAHGKSSGASFLSVASVVLRSGILVSLLYTYFKNLWFPIFFHFGWDLAEPTLFGAPNPGITVPQSVFEAYLTGPAWLTGGVWGPGNSLPAILLCGLVSFFLFRLAVKNNRTQPASGKLQ